MTTLYKIENGEPIDIPDDEIGNAISSGQYGYQQGQEIKVKNQSGEIGTIPIDQILTAQQQGYTTLTNQEKIEHEAQQKYGDTLGQTESALLGVARGLSFGASDWLLKNSDTVSSETLKGLAQANPIASNTGEIGGTIGGLLIPGLGEAKGASLLKGLGSGVKTVAKIGTKLEKSVAESVASVMGHKTPGVLENALGKAIGQGAEGLAYGGGQALSQSTMEPSATPEQLMWTIGASALLGAGVGGIGDLGISGLKYGSKLITKTVEDATNKLAQKALKIDPNVAKLTKEELEQVLSIDGKKALAFDNKVYSDQAETLTKELDSFRDKLPVELKKELGIEDKVKWTQSQASKNADEVLIKVDTKELDNAWQKDKSYYVGAGQEKQAGKRENFERFLKQGKDIEAPRVELWDKPEGTTIMFGDGRHRTAVLRDKGEQSIVVAVDKSNVPLFMNKMKSAALYEKEATKVIDPKSLENLHNKIADNPELKPLAEKFNVITGTNDKEIKLRQLAQKGMIAENTSSPILGMALNSIGGTKGIAKKATDFLGDNQPTIEKLMAGDKSALTDMLKAKLTPENLQSFVANSLKNPLGAIKDLAFDASIGLPLKVATGGYIASRRPIQTLQLLSAVEKAIPESKMKEQISKIIDEKLMPTLKTGVLSQTQKTVAKSLLGGSIGLIGATSANEDPTYGAIVGLVSGATMAKLGKVKNASQSFGRKATVPLATKIYQKLYSKDPSKNPIAQLKNIQQNPQQALAHLDPDLQNQAVNMANHLLATAPQGKYVSKIDLKKWADRWAVCEEPLSILDDLNNGSLTKDKVDSLKTVYPSIYAQIKERVMLKLGSADNVLPYDKRVQIAVLFDALDKNSVVKSQEVFKGEPTNEQSAKPSKKIGKTYKPETQLTRADKQALLK